MNAAAKSGLRNGRINPMEEAIDENDYAAIKTAKEIAFFLYEFHLRKNKNAEESKTKSDFYYSKLCSLNDAQRKIEAKNPNINKEIKVDGSDDFQKKASLKYIGEEHTVKEATSLFGFPIK